MIRGSYDFGVMTLFIDHVQGDPFALPSRIRVRMEMSYAGIPRKFFATKIRKIATCDYLARQFSQVIARLHRSRTGSGKSGLISIDSGAQEVLERASMRIEDNFVEARLEIGLPADGRRILGMEASKILLDLVPKISDEALRMERLDEKRMEEFVHCVENQDSIRSQLESLGLCAFVANCSILPRITGHKDEPMQSSVVPFKSPADFELSLDLPNPRSLDLPHTRITGMGIPKGITLIVGGGYHGKSTLLQALERCVYAHIPGDGREYVVTNPSAVKIRAEDGRSVRKVNISPFITHLPHGKDTHSFSSEDASGSTSQATNIMEAIEIGASLLLMDEDTCATNFMIRDVRMQQLVSGRDEPIRPFIDWIREIYEQAEISTILVMGGCGDYLELADQVLTLREYKVLNQTGQARQICQDWQSLRKREASDLFPQPLDRLPARRDSLPSKSRRDSKVQLHGLDKIVLGYEEIDLRQVEQIADCSQLRAIGYSLQFLLSSMDGMQSLQELLEKWEKHLETNGLDSLSYDNRLGEHPGSFAKPRRFELAAALNRMRSLSILDPS